MGEDSYRDNVLYVKQRLHTVAPPPAAETAHQNGEEPYTIKCICGFDDDTFDGNVVLCDRCNSWQHISCYYHPQTTLEEDFEHNCVDCDSSRKARLDPAAAASRQSNLRPGQLAADARKPKRPAAKTHKKSRTRDLGNNHEAWAANDTLLSEGRGDSPRDQAPPPKRPKTSHKHSASTNNATSRPINGRKRSDSFPATAAEQPKIPLSQCPPDYLSPDFIHVHRTNTDFRHTQTNLHQNLDVTNLLSNWLDDPDAFAEATGGKSHNDVFQHFPKPIEELETPIKKHCHIDESVKFHGQSPVWPYLTVETDLMPGDFVGELRGSIGRCEDYMKDEANQWSKLRHPEHFVFFHPILPIYIDSRTEGSLLRYARRSCRPNLKMETIITGAREYRFCFTAIGDIPKGTEISIPWDTTHDDHLLNALRKSFSIMSDTDVLHVSDWVGTILAHFGGCACQQPIGNASSGPCLLAHFDRRLSGKVGDLLVNGKSRKRRRPLKQQSSENDHLAPSRASSDGPLHNNPDVDLDMADDRSQTHSTGTKSSRDVTPYSTRDSIVGNPDLSERDKRKLLQQEKLFEQMEQDTQHHGQRKRKRHSGSNANTPVGTTQVRPFDRATPESLVDKSKKPFARSSSSHAANGKGRAHESGVSPVSTATHTPVGRSIAASPSHGRPVRASGLAATRPVYCDNSTQTYDPEPAKATKNTNHSRPLVCRTKQLLKRSLFQSHRKRQPITPPSTSSSAPEAAATAETMSPKEEGDDSAPVKQESPKEPTPMDLSVENPEADVGSAPGEPVGPVVEEECAPLEAPPESPLPAHPILKPPPPPWISSTSHEERDAKTPPLESSHVEPMHIDVPPPELPKVSTPPESPVETPTGSGAPITPVAPTAAQEAAKPNGAGNVKKMSLSDYLKRRKTETPVLERTQSQAMAGGLTSSPGDEAAAKDSPSTPTSNKAI